MLVRHLPGRVGTKVRWHYYRRRLGSLGPGVRIDEGVHIVGPAQVHIGAGSWIAAGAFIGAGPPSLEHRVPVRSENPDFRHAEGEVHLGDYAYVAPGVLINGHGGVQVGDNVAISAGAKVFSSSHSYRDADGERGRPEYPSGMRSGPEHPQALRVAPVVIGDESFVGALAVVLPGTTMGPSTWLGTGSVGRGRLEPRTVYGSPTAAPIG